MILVVVAVPLGALSCAIQAGPGPPHGPSENHDRNQQRQPYGRGRLENWQHTTTVKLKHHVAAKHASSLPFASKKHVCGSCSKAPPGEITWLPDVAVAMSPSVYTSRLSSLTHVTSSAVMRSYAP